MRTAIGRMAGPLNPPTTLDSRGRRVSTSMAMARNVLTRDAASAPASRAAAAKAATFATFGVSFGMRGRRVTRRTAATTSCVPCNDEPNIMPPFLMFGQEMFSSIAATPSASSRMRATSVYSSMVEPQMLTMTTAPRSRSGGSFSATKRRTPIPCRPMAFNIPLGSFHDALRGVSLALIEKQSLDRDRAEAGEVHDVGVLDPVAEAAAGRDEGVRERESPDVHREVDTHPAASPSQTTVRPSKTGPSRQERTKWGASPGRRTGTTQL